MSGDMHSETPEAPPPPPTDDNWRYTPMPPAGAGFGPPPWPPQYAWTPAPRRRRRFRTAVVSGVATVAIAAATGVTVVALGSAHGATSTASTAPGTPGSQSSGNGSSGSQGSGTASLAQVEQAVVDINATLAGGRGEVAGIGMVITPSGEVLTNNHVIEGAQSITVQIAGSGPTYTATVIGDDPAADIALLQIHGVSGLRTVVLGNSSAVTVGESITAIGNALGRGGVPATSTGTVTALDQTVTAGDQTGSSETLSGTIRVNAAIQPGDSGGPVVNDAGQVIGMTTAGSTSGGYREQFGATTTAFAISINQAMTIVREIQAGGAGDASVHIGAGVLLGVEVDSQAGTSGAAVVGVQAGSPAAAAGLAAGDTVTAVGGQSVASSADLRSALQRHSPGDSVSVTWIDASGSQHTATVQLVAGPPA